MTVDFEEVTQLLAAVTAAETVGTQDFEFLGWDPLTNLFSKQLHVVGRGDHRTFAAVEAFFDVAQLWLLARVQTVAALHGEAVATQFVEAGHAPHVGADVELLTQDL